MSKKQSDLQEIDNCLIGGGVFYKNGVQVFVDNPEDFKTVASPTGFWIKSALGFTVYFKANSRKSAQEVCNEVFGKGRYTVNSKV